MTSGNFTRNQDFIHTAHLHAKGSKGGASPSPINMSRPMINHWHIWVPNSCTRPQSSTFVPFLAWPGVVAAARCSSGHPAHRQLSQRRSYLINFHFQPREFGI